MSFIKENEYRKYIQDNFMNQAATKHLENQTNNDSISENNTIFRNHEELIEKVTENDESIDFSYIDNAFIN